MSLLKLSNEEFNFVCNLADYRVLLQTPFLPSNIFALHEKADFFFMVTQKLQFLQFYRH